eukprot:CAMPEP_0206817590 /NCGR_PEP_ID=MMETSP0975-20121206/10373_1 /ASSEMBLY_ACC=CAM_ASM_000399 /TAXON_ID=483370 /ORGANISM="non described non described, Strain CCMP2097" /LENGTH=82 /DNA_ID=CAMNT_0054359791 /DNA_START=41 /DNA_END=290 /DNA_ORIENTATION=-
MCSEVNVQREVDLRRGREASRSFRGASSPLAADGDGDGDGHGAAVRRGPAQAGEDVVQSLAELVQRVRLSDVNLAVAPFHRA